MNSNEKTLFNEENYIYDKYISGTQKLWKNEKSDFIQAYILDKKEIGRKFLKNNSVSYYEIFEDKRLNILGQTKKISLLFFPMEDNVQPFEMKNCFGFRYYEKNVRDKCNYFTLIKKEKKGYYILEKRENIKDVDNVSFFNKDLDCFSIMKNIVYDKYKENYIHNKSPHGELFSEIIGYIYSLIYLGQFKNFILLEPFIPNRSVKESLKEEIPSVLQDNVGYIEPILFENHVSVLLIVKDEILKRKNYLLDMSRYHSKKNIYDYTLIPICLIKNLTAYPNKSIQKNNSCGLWCYGILDLIYSSNIYNGPQDILDKIEFNRSDFYIDVVNLLSEKIYGLKGMINFETFDASEVDVKKIYDSIDGEIISFLKECIKNYYFSLSQKYDWIGKNKDDVQGMDLLFNYEKLFEEIIKYKGELEMNNEYFKEYCEPEYYNLNIKKKMEFQLDKVINFYNSVNENFSKEFRNIAIDNIYEYLILLEEKNDDENYKGLEQRFNSLKKTKTKNIFELTTSFFNIQKNFKQIKLLDESTIVHNLNPNSEILFKLLNK